ncbi:Protein of unknown function, partial [Gryllus bimaculatus]
VNPLLESSSKVLQWCSGARIGDIDDSNAQKTRSSVWVVSRRSVRDLQANDGVSELSSRRRSARGQAAPETGH